MRNIFTIFKREMRTFFTSPLAYVIAFIFLILTGLFFTSFVGSGVANVGYLGDFLLLILFICPILTIKLISEEKRSGTFELLLTSPISSLEIVLGKFLATLGLYTLMLSVTLIYVLFMAQYSDLGPDYGIAFTSYLGIFLLGASLIAIGVFASSLTSSQMVAAIISLGMSLFFLLIDRFFIQGTGSNIDKIAKELSLLNHFFSFYKGILDTKDIIYYFLWISLALMLAFKSVESHIWKIGSILAILIFAILYRTGYLFNIYLILAMSLIIIGLVVNAVFNFSKVKKLLSQRIVKKEIISITMIFLFIGVLTAVYVVAKNHPKRFDLTAEKMFTLSKKSISVLKDLDTNINIKVLAAEQERDISGRPYLPLELIELLKLYNNGSEKVNVTYHSAVRNPLMFKQYNLPQGDGVGALIIEVLDKNKKVIRNITVLQRDLIEFSFNPRTQRPAPKFQGESKITSILASLKDIKQLKIYYTTGHGEKSFSDPDEENYGNLKSTLELENYTIKNISLSTVKDIPKDCNLLIIPGPISPFNSAEIEKIKRYLTKGGNLFILIDPVIQKVKTGLESLFKEWNVTIDESVILESDPNYLFVQNNQAIPFLHLARFGNHKIVEPFNKKRLPVYFYYTRPLLFDSTKLTDGLTITPILQTSAKAWGTKGTKEIKLDKGKDIQGPMSFGLAINKKYSHKDQKGKKISIESRIVIIGDSDFVKNGFTLEGNFFIAKDLFLNSINWLVQQEKKITIRPKEAKRRSLVLTQQRRTYIFLVTVLIIPFSVVGLGILVFFRRKKQKS